MKLKSKSLNLKNTKVQLAISLAIVAAGLVIPDNAISRAEPPAGGGFCHSGDLGDCEKTTAPCNPFRGCQYICAEGGFGDDCA